MVLDGATAIQKPRESILEMGHHDEAQVKGTGLGKNLDSFAFPKPLVHFRVPTTQTQSVVNVELGAPVSIIAQPVPQVTTQANDSQ
mmetsp:Transcript_10413/g.24146  ORF Transcript_10413/g.24146 Transcript_10413/m.24146 type:complete len:86 (+) Transcript_10413:1496-1753(+)